MDDIRDYYEAYWDKGGICRVIFNRPVGVKEETKVSESKIQDPKYCIIDGALANASSRELIPDQEPVFILRAQDKHAVAALRGYVAMCSDPDHRRAVVKRIWEFEEFAMMNPERIGEPDTDGANKWPSYGRHYSSAGEDADREMIGDDAGMIDNVGDK